VKIILSRKGYDSENGGGPSPILPDGRMVSLPIPSSSDARRYGELLGEDGKPICQTLRDLNVFDSGVDARCHLDPDLGAWSVPREPGWKPGFGQLDAAAAQLDNQGVGVGDLFLFFGWFRRTEIVGGKLRFVQGAHQDLHVIFGWLEIGEIVRPTKGSAVPAGLADHPHYSERRRANSTNRIYVARDRLTVVPKQPGAGVFRYSEHLVLTKPGMSRTRWALDRAVFGNVEISYHSADSWEDGFFQSAKKGQEFVLAANDRVGGWLRELFEVAPTGGRSGVPL
jgi:hypothetical protein